MKSHEIDDRPDLTQQQKTLAFYRNCKQKEAKAVRVRDPLALIDDAVDEALAAAAGPDLDQDLAAQGFDPATLARNALRLRTALRAESLRTSEDTRSNSPSGSESPRASASSSPVSVQEAPLATKQRTQQRPVGTGRSTRSPGYLGGALQSSRTKRYVVGLRTDPQLVDERAALAEILHRVQSKSGLGGRIGYSIVFDPLCSSEATECNRLGVDGEASIDLLLICRSPKSFSAPASEASGLALLRSSPDLRFWQDAGRPRTLVLLGALSGAARSPSASPTDRALDLRHADTDRESVSLIGYDDPKELEQILLRELTRWLLETRFALQLGGGTSLQIDYPAVRAHTTLCIAFGGAALLGDSVQGNLAVEHLWNRVAAVIGEYQAALGGVFLDIAFFHFQGFDCHRRAVQAAELLLRTVPSLVDRDKAATNPDDLSVRLCVHELPATTGPSPTVPEGLVFLAALTESPEADAGILVTASVRQRLPAELSARFRSIGRFCGEPLWLFESRGPTILLRGRTMRRIDELESQIVRLETAVRAAAAPARAVLDVVSTAVDKIYALLAFLANRAQRRRDRAPGELAELTSLVESALGQEERAWHLISEMVARGAESTDDDAWKAPVYLAAARRGPIVAQLRKVAEPAGTIPTPNELPFQGARIIRAGKDHRLNASLLDDLRHLIHGDDLDTYSTFTNLASNFKSELLAVFGCGQPVPQDEIRQLGSRLWILVDLAVAEDESEPRRVDRCLVPQIASGPFGDERFAALCNFLFDSPKEETWGPEDALRAAGALVRFENVETLWTCRLLTARKPVERLQAIEQVALGRLWNLLTYPRTPWATVVTIVQRFAKVHLEGHGQICFDCLTSRLARTLNAGSGEDHSLPEIREVLKAFGQFDFSVTTSKFEQLRKLVELYIDRTGGPARQAEEFWRAGAQGGVPASAQPERMPEILSALPAVVQRHLASEGRYIEHFACHPDYRIARETARFIRPHRLRQIVAPGSLNGRLLRDLLRQPGLWNDPGDLEVVLNHPKCDPFFANHQLSRLSPQALLRIVRNPGANPQIRRQAGRIIHVHGFHPRGRPGSTLGRAGGRQ